MAKDFTHEMVRTVLVRDGWIITHDPFELQGNDPDWQIDLAAEIVIAAEEGQHKIAVEVKSFLGTSFSYDFHQALGQYLNYRASLKEFEPERKLYLSVPFEVYQTHFFRSGVARSVRVYEVCLLIYDPVSKLIIQWEPHPIN